MVRTFLWFKSRFCGTLDVKWLCLVLQVKHLHTLGVASLHCPAKVGKRTVLLVESVLTSCPEKLAGRNDGHVGSMMLWSDSCSCSGNRCLLHLYTSKNKLIMVNASCWVFPEHQEGLPASLPLSQFRTNFLPTKVRAHGVITLGNSRCHDPSLLLPSPLWHCLLPLGKLCLQHENLVQKYLPVFARELEVGTEVAVRNNVVVILCDLCVRYTNIVDLYIPNISACLRDDVAVIREQTLIMLTNLLQVSALLLSVCDAAVLFGSGEESWPFKVHFIWKKMLSSTCALLIWEFQRAKSI